MDTSPETKIDPALREEKEMGEGGVHGEAKGDGGTAISTLKKLWAATTYEPLLLLHSIVHFGTVTLTESLIAEKSCLVTLGKPEEICKELYDHPNDEIEVAPFLYSLGGAMGSFQMLVFACISDVTTDANRTYRLGILKIFMAFGSPTGRVVGGQMYALGGYVAVYGLALGILGICLLLLVFTAESVKFGDNDPLYFLFFKLMFDWDATDYSNWFFYRDMTKAIALVLLMPVFVGRLRLPDSALGLLGCSSVAFMQIALGQIVSPSMAWVALLGPLLGMLELFAHLASRSIMSKCSDGSRELGKLFAAQAVLDSIATGLAGPLYAAVYSSSVDSLPMAQFLLAALFMFLAVLGIGVCDIFLQKKEAEPKHEDLQEKA